MCRHTDCVATASSSSEKIVYANVAPLEPPKSCNRPTSDDLLHRRCWDGRLAQELNHWWCYYWRLHCHQLQQSSGVSKKLSKSHHDCCHCLAARTISLVIIIPVFQNNSTTGCHARLRHSALELETVCPPEG